MVRCIKLILYLSLFSLVIISCDEEKIVSGDIKETGKVEVSGIVYRYYCNEVNAYNGSLRYTISTGYKAFIRFQNSEKGYIFSTNDSSDYTGMIDTGTYNVVVECAHTINDTIGIVNIVNDTTIDSWFPLIWLCPDSLYLKFGYDSIEDSIGDSAEIYYLNFLDLHLGQVLDLENPIIDRYVGVMDKYYVSYRCKVDDSYYSWQVMEMANAFLEGSLLPVNLYAYKDEIWCTFE